MPKAKSIDHMWRKKHHDKSGQVARFEGKNESEICPECGAKLIHEAGCIRCVCGWSRC